MGRPGRSIVAIVAGLLLALGGVAPAPAEECPWVGSQAPVETRVGMVLAEMSPAEKLSMVHGSLTDLAGITGPVYAGLVPAIERLCIPRLGLLDGPAGVGNGLTNVTHLPAPVSLASSWDTDLARRFGDVIGTEADGKGAGVSLAPAIDIVRDPRAGRSFEVFGEDPYLTSRLGVAEIEGIQSNGIIAQPKHYAIYNQETLRDTAADDAIVDERTMHEIYLPPFEAAVTEAGAGSVMCSYNYVNGVHACNHPYLLTQVLKGQWGFDGFVTSDWYAAHASAAAANAGLDMQMPDDCYFGRALERAITDGRVPMSRLDDMVSRILRSMFRAGLFDRAPGGTPQSDVRRPAHTALAREAAAAGMVLLRNEGGVLPLSTAPGIAVIGVAADRPVTGGGGSSSVAGVDVVTPLEGIGARTTVVYDDGSNPVSAAAVARDARVAIVFVRLMQGEFKDRASLELFPTDTVLIEAVAAANPNTIVVLNTGSAVTMPWIERAAGVLAVWYPGQEYGHALADVLFGDVNPAGKLPMTFPKDVTQLPTASPRRWPGAEYSEGLHVGYRWYDAKGIEPLFGFGFGLSYTTFSLTNLSVSPATTGDGSVEVEADVANTGSRAGAEVVQMYLSHPPAVGEPPKSLRGFAKVTLDPGETTRVRFELDARALATWDSAADGWVAAPGTYGVLVGTSSRDIALTGAFALTTELRPGPTTPPAPILPPIGPEDAAADDLSCPKDFIAPFVNGALSVTGFPPFEVLGRPVP